MKISPSIMDGHYQLDGVTYGFSKFTLIWFKELGIDPKVIFDFGCHDGGDSIRFKREFPNCNVYAFEPDPDCFAQCKDLLARYNVVLNQNAIGDQVGTREFYPSKDNKYDNGTRSAQGSFYKHSKWYREFFTFVNQSQQPIVVNMTTLQKFCGDNNITDIDLLQIDVEGAEHEVISGMGTLRPKLLFLETGYSGGDNAVGFDGGTYNPTLFTFLESLDYVLLGDYISDRLYIHKSAIK